MALRARYGIGGDHTIPRWVRQYGREGVRHKLMRIQHASEHDRVKELEARIQDLESALAEKSLDELMYKAMLRVVEEKYGIDLKKETDGTSLKPPASLPRTKGNR